MEEKMNRPLILEIDEAKKEFIQVINNAIQVHKLPFYIIDMMLDTLHAEVKNGAKSELEMAKVQAKQQDSKEEVA
jgi:hypothetical protein